MAYILIDKQQSRSRTGARLWRLTWVCLDDFTRWETSIAEDMDNFLNNGWRSVCNNPTPWGVYVGLKRTSKTNKEGIPIITADSKQERIISIESQDLACDVIMAAKESSDDRTVTA